MQQEIKPKATLYGGTRYRSMAEAKTAESLDRLGLDFEYERDAARGPRYVGGQYTPDFWVPGLNAYIEVAGVWDERHKVNTAEFARESGCLGWYPDGTGYVRSPVMVHVDGDGYLHPVLPMGDDEEAWRRDAEPFHRGGALLLSCRRCGALFMRCVHSACECPSCGFLNGKGSDPSADRRVNLFDAAGVRRYGGR